MAGPASQIKAECGPIATLDFWDKYE
jgi:hypothetical protein